MSKLAALCLFVGVGVGLRSMLGRAATPQEDRTDFAAGHERTWARLWPLSAALIAVAALLGMIDALT